MLAFSIDFGALPAGFNSRGIYTTLGIKLAPSPNRQF
jgi:hypothetical protein